MIGSGSTAAQLSYAASCNTCPNLSEHLTAILPLDSNIPEYNKTDTSHIERHALSLSYCKVRLSSSTAEHSQTTSFNKVPNRSKHLTAMLPWVLTTLIAITQMLGTLKDLLLVCRIARSGSAAAQHSQTASCNKCPNLSEHLTAMLPLDFIHTLVVKWWWW